MPKILELNILHLSSARHFGGGEKHLVNLIRGLHHKGYCLYTVVRAAADWKDQLNYLASNQIICLPLHNAFDLSSAIKLSRLIKEFKIDVIHAHLARDYIIAATAAMLNRSVKLVFTRHLLFPLHRIHLLTFKRAAAVVAVSNAVAQMLAKGNLVNTNKIRVIPNGVDVHEFVPPEKRIRTRYVIGMVGELSPVKNQELFIHAANLVTKELTNVSFQIAGEDNSPDKRYMKFLQSLISQYDLAHCVKLEGNVNPIAPFYNSLDLFVSTSQTEAFGLAILEAMTSGLAIIATSTDGAHELIDEERSGRLIPIDCAAEDLATEIIRLLNDDGRRERMGTEARAKALKDFSLDQMINATDLLYRQVVEDQIFD